VNTGRLVGEEGFEPSRPLGHTDLNRARLPFRHPPWASVRLARHELCQAADTIEGGRGEEVQGGSAAALRAPAPGHV
jgi:hypothetical protein